MDFVNKQHTEKAHWKEKTEKTEKTEKSNINPSQVAWDSL